LLLGYTPLRNLIPGKSKTHVQNELIMMIQKADSLEKSLGNYSLYTKNLKKVLSDSVSLDSVQDLFRESFTVKEFDFKPSVEDSILRAEVEAEESISLNSNLKEKKLNSFFIKPVDGLITEGFNKKIGHFGVDVVSKKGAFISSIDDGMVLFSSWTHEFGYVLVIKHQNSFISFYKHNSEVFKSKGDYVKSGETIAIIGNSGTLITKVIYIKDSESKKFIILDAAMNDLMRPALYGAIHKTLPVIKSGKVSKKTYEFVGPICESTDKFVTIKNFQELHEKDYIAICDVGAYGMSLSSNYNLRTKPLELLIKNNKIKIIRKRQKHKDLI